MPQMYSQLQLQLSRARVELDQWTKNLDKKGVAADVRSIDPRWRSLHAHCLTIESRMRAAKKLLDRDAELIARRSERASAAPGAKRAPLSTSAKRAAKAAKAAKAPAGEGKKAAAKKPAKKEKEAAAAKTEKKATPKKKKAAE